MIRDGDLSFRWNDAGDIASAATFAAKVIGAQTSYISHGEIQAGLSDDGISWVSDLEARYVADLADLEGRDFLAARGLHDQIVAFLIVAFEETRRRKFAVIEDMAVDPALRGAGVGAKLLGMAQQQIRDRCFEWVFLESGIRNEAAHHFFKREGFQPISQVFAKKLTL